MFSEDFTDGDADYCTSCDMDSLPIVDLGADKPTCVAELPARRAMVVMQNNKILGVSVDATPYGGAKREGQRTQEAQEDPNSDRDTNTDNGPPPTVEDSEEEPTEGEQPNGEMNDDDYSKEIKIRISHEAHLPKVMDLINGKYILGVGSEKEDSKNCLSSVGKERVPRNVNPGIVYLAVSCPENCAECMISKYGSLKCMKADDGFKVMNGEAVDSCPTEGYVEHENYCIKCSGGPGCKTCSFDADTKMTICSECYLTKGYVLETVTENGMDIEMCVQQQCTDDDSMYWNGSECMACLNNCDVCQDDMCMFCGEDKVMKINEDGSRMCFNIVDECGQGFYVNDQNLCKP